jgi:hypothetical protein
MWSLKSVRPKISARNNRLNHLHLRSKFNTGTWWISYDLSTNLQYLRLHRLHGRHKRHISSRAKESVIYNTPRITSLSFLPILRGDNRIVVRTMIAGAAYKLILACHRRPHIPKPPSNQPQSSRSQSPLRSVLQQSHRFSQSPVRNMKEAIVHPGELNMPSLSGHSSYLPRSEGRDLGLPYSTAQCRSSPY